MVGIVSRSDLVRAVATQVPKPTMGQSVDGLLSLFAGMMQTNVRPEDAPAAASASTEPAALEREPVTAGSFRKLVIIAEETLRDDAFAAKQLAALERLRQIKAMLLEHLDKEVWATLIDRAQAAAAEGESSFELMRFPCDLCSDGGRKIGVAENDWPTTLRGEAAEVYARWEHELRPTGFRLRAQIVEYLDGIPNNIALSLAWPAAEFERNQEGPLSRIGGSGSHTPANLPREQTAPEQINSCQQEERQPARSDRVGKHSRPSATLEMARLRADSWQSMTPMVAGAIAPDLSKSEPALTCRQPLAVLFPASHKGMTLFHTLDRPRNPHRRCSRQYPRAYRASRGLFRRSAQSENSRANRRAGGSAGRASQRSGGPVRFGSSGPAPVRRRLSRRGFVRGWDSRYSHGRGRHRPSPDPSAG